MGEERQELVFVYGTLRPGSSNHFRMEEAELQGRAWVLGRLYPLGWYPGLVLDDGGIPVRGEVYAVEREMLRKLDAFEGSEYERLKFPVHLEGGNEVRAWLYEFRGDEGGREEIVPADWLQHEAESEASAPCRRWSKVTFLLFPLAVVTGTWALWLDVSGPRWFALVAGLLAGAFPLVPFFTGRLASKRREQWAEGAEVCAALSFIAFLVLLIARYWPLAFEAFPN